MLEANGVSVLLVTCGALSQEVFVLALELASEPPTASCSSASRAWEKGIKKKTIPSYCITGTKTSGGRGSSCAVRMVGLLYCRLHTLKQSIPIASWLLKKPGHTGGDVTDRPVTWKDIKWKD